MTSDESNVGWRLVEVSSVMAPIIIADAHTKCVEP
jgi:hypothetical protein